MALLTAVNGLYTPLCSLKAFGRINLSLYSVFNARRYAAALLCGIVFFEKGSPSAALHALFLHLRLTLTVKRGKSADKKYFVYYIEYFF